ncbi:MAG TPA: carboxypeptidase-like regulatory domain-containing protein [Bacteroidia bacterium]|jgi:hypothetical protein|nr:carboxypeptidase-like regulatory domain-containing protein [Bacteroidia bacterium]
MKFRALFTAYILAFGLLFNGVKAQNTGNIRGFIYTKDNGEPALFTSVYLKGTTLGASTDLNGFFSITKIPPGTYTLLATYLGCDTAKEEITVTKGQIINKKYYLAKAAVQLSEVVLTAEQQSKKEDTKVSVQKIDPKMINKLPSVGEPDIAQYLQVLPGVVFTGDQGGQLYIRGGSPVQNKVLLDGMIIYNPFHSIGLFSVFDNDIIKNADVYTGGFGAEYGGRTSSIMDITTRDGNKTRMSGKVSASTFGAKAMLEGPMMKLKENGNTSMSFLVTGKTSYLPYTSKYLYRYADTAGLPFGFADLYGKISLNTNNGSKLSLFGFNFNDKVDYTGIATFKWKSIGGGTNFVLVPGNSSTLIEGNFSYSQYQITQTSPTQLPRSSSINGFNGGFKFSNFIGRNEIRYGFELIGFGTNFNFHNDFGREIKQEATSTEIAGYVKTKLVFFGRKLILEPSFRLHEYASLGQISPEPRFSGKYNINNRIRFKFASGLYAQNLLAANSDRDVVNLFYGFLFTPDDLQDYYSPKPGQPYTKSVNSRLQKANHLIAGFEFDLFKHIDVNIEAYQKQFTMLTSINRDKIVDETTHPDFPDYQKKDVIVETGYARGIDCVIKYDVKRFYFWATYSLAYNRRWDGVREYFPVFDRRHNINLVSSYSLDRKKHWEINARWNMGTGFPVTPTQGYYQQLNLGNYMGNYTTQNGQLGYVSGALFSQRLPDYHRLDLSVKYKYNWAQHAILEITAGATNVYNRANIFYFDRVTFKQKNQLPVLPNVNMSFTF